jgi:guanylate kinase
LSGLPPKPVIVITGPSGAGKGTLEQELLRRLPGQLELSVSATTRPRRPGEVDGVHYWFLSDAEFDRKVEEKEFLEWVPYVSGHRYGTLKSEIDRIRDAGRAPLLDLELNGTDWVRKRVPDAVMIFVTVPAFSELERRLRERATESAGEIDDRLQLAREQLARADEFEIVVVNDDVDRAAAELTEIVAAELGITPPTEAQNPKLKL